MDNSELISKLEQLEKENASLKAWQKEVNSLLSGILNMLDSQKGSADELRQQIATVYKTAKINRYRIDSLPYEMAASDYDLKVFSPNILGIEETRRLIIDEKKSIARLGDGEFSAISGVKRWNFQNASEELGKRMRDVLASDNPGLLIGLNPNFYSSLQNLSEEDADGVRAYMRPMVRRLHAELLSRDKVYADALFTKIESDEDMDTLRMIWKDRDCVIIEGQYTRMGVGNDLLEGARSIKRILAPSESAFDRYDEILSEAQKQPEDSLFLIALGPTATVLAYDLFNSGFQALDIGHLDLIYEKYVRKLNSLYEVKIPYKYCNSDELGDRRTIEELKDSSYEGQIIAGIY